MIENHELNIFVNVAETMSFTEAAKRLHVSQPAVSMQISNLESRLNTVLFDRSGRNISPTEAAEVLLPMAREILNFSTHIEETMASLHGSLIGHLQVACSTSAGKYVLPHLIARFREPHPDVRVTVSICTPESYEPNAKVVVGPRGVEAIQFRAFSIPTDVLGRFYVNFRGPQKTFEYYSASEVLNDRVDPAVFRDRYVLLGTSAGGLRDLRATPFENDCPGVEVHANVIATLLNDDPIQGVPAWLSGALNLLALGLSILAFWHFRPVRAVAAVALLIIMYLATAFLLFSRANQ